MNIEFKCPVCAQPAFTFHGKGKIYHDEYIQCPRCGAKYAISGATKLFLSIVFFALLPAFFALGFCTSLVFLSGIVLSIIGPALIYIGAVLFLPLRVFASKHNV